MLKKIRIVIKGIPRTNSINQVERIRNIGIFEVRAKARSIPIGIEITMVKIATSRVREIPPRKKSPGTSIVDGVFTAVTSQVIIPDTPNQARTYRRRVLESPAKVGAARAKVA